MNVIPSLEQSMSKGKPIFILPNTNIQDLSFVKQVMGYNPLTTSPAFSGSLNLSALQSVMMLLRIANVFLRVNQYALFSTDDDSGENGDDFNIAGQYTESVYIANEDYDITANEHDRGDGVEVCDENASLVSSNNR
jgi:hypothetical protein